ncbi:response regulator [Roseivirga sp. E12]|uniref:response regulator n=1 Tax=Roseivirga sp. E12 TaxID=2819237 RepID=UPI001ABC5EBD|nr:response regulator [Roseivirga sp. E12]MBO3697198.1 response regulator transcription factor [Roseivirga sp. E12]
MIRLLIVEDDFAVRDTLKDFIEFMYDDVEVSEAVDGKSASLRLDSENFDIMITDQMMPDMKGSDLISRYFDKLTNDGTWIYVYSGQMSNELRKQFEDFPQIEIIDKFTNPTFFKEIIDKFKESLNQA